MKICVDVRCLMDDRRTGIEEYTLNLLLNLLEIDRKNEYILFFNSWKKTAFDFSIFEKFENVTIKKYKIPNKILNFLFWYFAWPKIDRLAGGVDLVFMPNITFGSVSKKAKLILTIHDLSFERYPQYYSLKRKLWHHFVNPKKICQRAEKIIAVSDSTKNDVINLYKIDPKKVERVHSAVSDEMGIISRNDEMLVRTKEKYLLPYKFVLYFGTIEPRKNIAGIVRAYGQLQKFSRKNNDQEIQKIGLVIAGEKGWLSKKIFEEINNSDFREHIRVISPVCEKDKKYLYNLASIFVYPSFFEGFGFPPLEAMKCGVPVIASNNSSLAEIIGEGGILVDPDRPSEIFQSLRAILKNPELKKMLAQKALERSEAFSWKKASAEFWEIIGKMV